MSRKTPWEPWHKVVRLREDLRSGELSLSTFAADLHDVAMGQAPPVYGDPKEFFALTFPSFNLRELAKDVVLRLAGKNEKAVRQLELTYGGGKTHTLITLFHLSADPGRLPDLPAVAEFTEHIGQGPPKARIAVLPFDKLDVEKGMEIKDPEGRTRWLKNPWSVLAFQIAGADGLRLLHPENRDGERDTAPAENLLKDLLAIPARDGLATLVLIDEVLMYARGKVDVDPVWRDRLASFFQYLTQAAVKAGRCAVVASLLATDPRKYDSVGKEIIQDLYAVFRREREEGVQPIVKDDVAEVLRRRFFMPESIKKQETFRAHVVAALKGIADLDEATQKDLRGAEERYLRSYPFHPDLTDLFYSKWTNLEGFQRTRGTLRTFALALRDAERWDESPLVAANVFVGEPGRAGVGEAARELTTVAESEEYEGKRQAWTGILEGELAKAREIQAEAPGLKHREVEQAVFATFLHSQPIGQKALTRELILLLGATRPDRIELEKALRRWAEVSWFLDEAGLQEAEAGAEGRPRLPRAWRLGSRPNLRQMHHDARTRVSPDLVEAMLLNHIGSLKALTAGASGAGAKVHNLPERPREVDDDGEFRYVVLGPRAACDPGKPSPEAGRFLKETTGADRPRVYRNAVVCAAPSRDGLEIARNRIRDHLAWEEVKEQLKGQELDPVRAATLNAELDGARKRIPAAIEQAYCLVVTVSERDEAHAFKVNVGGRPLFQAIKEDARSRIQDTAVSAEALLPGGPYELWKEGELSRRVKDLVGAFSQFPHLPKMHSRKAILDTLINGCREGRFVLRAARPDRSVRTFWRGDPEEADLKDPGLEVVLPEAAELTEVPPSLLVPGVLPDLWKGPSLPFRELCEYFSGGRTVKRVLDLYEESIPVPRAGRPVLEAAVKSGVKEGRLWLLSGPASLLGEDVPAGVLGDEARLQAPPAPIAATDVLPESLPAAWSEGVSTALGVAAALSARAGSTLPWATVREAVDGAFRAGLLDRPPDSGPWPSDLAGARAVRLRLPAGLPSPPPAAPPPRTSPGALVAQAALQPGEIQDLSDRVADLKKAAAGFELRFHLRVELGGNKPPTPEVRTEVDRLLAEINPDLRLR